MNRQKYLYVVFSSTPNRMGKFIRFFTRNFYNHVSLALDEDLSSLYSFARRFHDMPFFGGFVLEFAERFRKGGSSQVKICALPVDEEQAAQARARMDDYIKNGDRNLYNLFSASLTLFRKRLLIKDAYTCAEFVADFIALTAPQYGLEEKRFYSIQELEKRFAPYQIFEGDFFEGVSSPENDYSAEHPLLDRLMRQVGSNWALFCRLFSRK